MVRSKRGTTSDDGTISDGSVEEDPIDEQPPQAMASGGIILRKFFQLHMPGVDKYHRAYLEAQFSGQVKTPDEWTAEIQNLIKKKEK